MKDFNRGMVSYNLQLGGTQPGWIGETSVPMTSHWGYSSAKSLIRKSLGRNQSLSSNQTHMAHIPAKWLESHHSDPARHEISALTGSCSNIESFLVVDGRVRNKPRGS